MAAGSRIHPVHDDIGEETRWAAFCPSRRDVPLAVGVGVFVNGALAVGLALEESSREITPWSFIVATVAALLLLFRKVQPGLTLVAIAVVVLPYLIAGGAGGPVGIPLWIGLYSIAAHGDRKLSAIAAVLSAVVVSVVVLLVGDEDPTTLERIAAIGLTLIPILIGDVVRSRRALIAQADERVRLAEAASEQQAERRVQDERVRIARELHDVVAHSIATINVQAGVAAHVIDTAPDAAKEALVEIKDASKMAMGELRVMLGVLRSTDDDGDEASPLSPSPGIAELEGLVDRFAGTATLEVAGDASAEVDPVVGLVLYRIVQEALTNTLKHTVDAAVEITLEYRPEDIALGVVDDGGAGRRESDDGGGLGLVGLDERARSVGGSFSARPRFSGGFEIAATVPYLPTESEDR